MMDVVPLEALKAHLERWAFDCASCAPANRKAAEEGICLAYQEVGLAPPERITWCGGPIEIAKQLAAASAGDHIGVGVKAQIFDSVRDRVGTFAEIFWKEIIVGASGLINKRSTSAASDSLERAKELRTAIHRAVRAGTHDVLSPLSVRSRHAIECWRGMPRLLPKAKFSDIAVGPDDLTSLGAYEYLRDAFGWKDETEPLRGLWAIAKSASWVVPHEHTCWIAERPDTLLTDTRGRLHCADGPALRYRDDWSVYAWKGVEVPAWMIEHPQWITPSKIGKMFDPVMRNTMIDIMTPKRFIATGDPSCVSKDDTGVLWRRFWSHCGGSFGSWCAVEVANATPEPDGSHKSYVLRVPSHFHTAREAVAWTYGMTAKQYAGLELRT
jgi:hypothetical protein